MAKRISPTDDKVWFRLIDPDAGFDAYRELYAAYPNMLLCVHYICDVGHVIVSGTEASVQQASTHNASHYDLLSPLGYGFQQQNLKIRDSRMV